jgi:hypothetical protein
MEVNRLSILPLISGCEPTHRARRERDIPAAYRIGKPQGSIMPDSVQDNVVVLGDAAGETRQSTAASVKCPLKVGTPDERGNTVKYIFSCDNDYVVYYSRLEHRTPTGDVAASSGGNLYRLRRFNPFTRHPSVGLPNESEGVQAQLSADPAKRAALRRSLVPLGTERAKLQALLTGWRRRQSYDSSIATALQLALGGDGSPEARDNALQTLRDAKASIMSEREIAGRAQYVRFALMLGLLLLFVLIAAQHNLFKDSGNFWLGTQAGVLSAILSIAIGIRGRKVALDIGAAGNLSDSALRLIIGAVSGGTLVLLFSTGLLPALQTVQGEQDGVRSVTFVVLLGIIAGFVEQLVSGLLDDQAGRLGNAAGTSAPAAVTDAATRK